MREMAPESPSANQIHSGFVHVELTRDVWAVNSSGSHSANRDHVCGREFSAAMILAAWMAFHLPKMIVGVTHVLFARDVLKIVRSIVALVAVFVVDLLAYRAWPKKGPSHKNMRQLAEIFVAALDLSKRYTFITSGGFWFKDAFTATDSPLRTNGVTGAALNRAPFFHAFHFTTGGVS